MVKTVTYRRHTATINILYVNIIYTKITFRPFSLKISNYNNRLKNEYDLCLTNRLAFFVH